MREILFRAKETFNSEWVEGYYEFGYSAETEEPTHYMWVLNHTEKYGDMFIVIPETVGQYTGLTDKNGKKIFEGDIVNVNTKPDSLEHGYKSNHLIVRFDEYHRFIASGRLEYPLCNHYEWEIIGNIHDNPELLKGE